MHLILLGLHNPYFAVGAARAGSSQFWSSHSTQHLADCLSGIQLLRCSVLWIKWMAVGMSCLQRQWLSDLELLGPRFGGHVVVILTITGPRRQEQTWKSLFHPEISIIPQHSWNKALSSFCSAANRLNNLLLSFNSAEFFLSILKSLLPQGCLSGLAVSCWQIRNQWVSSLILPCWPFERTTR